VGVGEKAARVIWFTAAKLHLRMCLGFVNHLDSFFFKIHFKTFFSHL